VRKATEFFDSIHSALVTYCEDPFFGVRFEQSAPTQSFDPSESMAEDDDVEIIGEGEQGDAIGVRYPPPLKVERKKTLKEKGNK
jgi:hypothetical protein